MKKVAIKTMFISLVIILLIVWLNSSIVYIKKKTGFRCWSFPTRIHSFNAVDHGKDYDSLYVFSLQGIDRARFAEYVGHRPEWRELPLDNSTMNNPLAAKEFSPQVNNMLNVQTGYYYVDTYYELYIYDTVNGVLYIRTASNITDYHYEY